MQMVMQMVVVIAIFLRAAIVCDPAMASPMHIQEDKACEGMAEQPKAPPHSQDNGLDCLIACPAMALPSGAVLSKIMITGVKHDPDGSNGFAGWAAPPVTPPPQNG